MNYYKTSENGGIPFVNDDHRWSDDSIRDYIDNHLSDLAVTIGTNGNFYLSGAEITFNGGTGKYTIADGYVYINGEILKVDTGIYNLVIAPNEYRIIGVETYDTTGDKTTRSGSAISTYRKRRAVPTVYAIADAWTDDMLAFDLTADQERILDKITYVVNTQESWHIVGAVGEPTYQGAWVADGTGAQFMKDSLGFVHIQGSVQSGTTGVVFTLPVGYRPSELLYVPMSNTGAVIYEASIGLIQTNGDVQMQNISAFSRHFCLSFRVA